MKKVLLLATVMVFTASLAFGQAGVIGTYGDAGGADCNVVDGSFGLLSVWVVHTLTPGATASQFSAPQPACMLGATYLSDTAMFPVTVGSSQTGVAIGYGACLAGPIAVLSINFFAAGATTTCCAYAILPDPNLPSGNIEVVDCGNNLLTGSGLVHTVNGDQTCDCALPVEESTWGGIKSLYSGQ